MTTILDIHAREVLADSVRQPGIQRRIFGLVILMLQEAVHPPPLIEVFAVVPQEHRQERQPSLLFRVLEERAFHLPAPLVSDKHGAAHVVQMPSGE